MVRTIEIWPTWLGPDSSSRASTSVEHMGLDEAFSVVIESSPALDVDLVSLALHEVEATSRTFILEVFAGAP